MPDSEPQDPGDQESASEATQRPRRLQLLTLAADGQFFAITSQSGKVFEPTSNHNVHGAIETTASPVAKQYWHLENINKEYYRIHNAETGECLDGTSATVSMSTCNNTWAQQWKIRADVNYGRISLNWSNQCLTLATRGNEMLTRGSCSSAATQLFRLAGGSPTPLSKAPGVAQVIADASGRFVAHTQTAIGQAQDPQPPLPFTSSDGYAFTLAGRPYYLGPKVGPGRYAFIAGGQPTDQSMKCLQANENSTTITSETCNLASRRQQFLLLRITMTEDPNPRFLANGRYLTIRSLINSRVLEVPNGNLSQGQRLGQWYELAPRAAWAQWYVERNPDGTFYIKNANSHLCMDVEGFATSSRANIQQWSCSGADNQKWRFFKASGSGSNIEWAIRNEHSKLFFGYTESRDGAAAMQSSVSDPYYGTLRFSVSEAPPVEVVQATRNSARNVPDGLVVSCARDGVSLDESSTCSVVHLGSSAIWAHSYFDNREALGITSYDREGNMQGSPIERSGTRYVWKINVDATRKLFTFWGQSNTSVSLEYIAPPM